MKIDLIGQKFGRLVVTEELKERYRGQVAWLCECECGKSTEVCGHHLRSGHTTSCGCLWLERANISKKHGHTRGRKETPEHKSWSCLRQRCENSKRLDYGRYGRRGIQVCRGFAGMDGFFHFLSAVGLRPTPSHSIDRKNNNGNYSCGECEQCLTNAWPMNLR